MRHVDQSGRHDGQTTVLGSFLKGKRECAGLTLTALAARVGIGRTELSRIERGISVNPSSRLLVQIANKGGIDISAVDLLYIAAGMLGARDLPSFEACVCAIHPDWPETAARELANFHEFMCQKYSRDEREP